MYLALSGTSVPLLYKAKQESLHASVCCPSMIVLTVDEHSVSMSIYNRGDHETRQDNLWQLWERYP